MKNVYVEQTLVKAHASMNLAKLELLEGDMENAQQRLVDAKEDINRAIKRIAEDIKLADPPHSRCC